MPVLSLNEALNQGSSPSELRAVANSLERIARQGYYHVVQDEIPDPDGGFDVNREYMTHHEAYDPVACRANARSLRTLARQLSETKSRGVSIVSV